MAYTRVTREGLRARLQAKWESTPFWTDTEANNAINEALRWMNLYTAQWKQRAVITTTANTVYYTLPSTLIYNTRMEFNGRSLVQSSFTDLDNGRPGWEAETTATDGAPDTPQLWLPVGMLTIAIWPADAVGQNSLVVDGVHATPTLASDGAFVDLDDADLEVLLGEALFLAAFKDPGRFPRTTGWHEAFLDAMMAANWRLNASNAFRHAAGKDIDRVATPLEAGTEPQ